MTSTNQGIIVGAGFLDPANAPDGAAYTVDGGATRGPTGSNVTGAQGAAARLVVTR